jgi:4-hydroxy-2-oxoheptanedioate aldolase
VAHLNRIRTLWEAGQPVANGWLSLGSAFGAEVYALQGYDSVTIDMQHGMFGFAETLAALQAIRTTEAVPLVRVPALEASIVSKVLDAGALGIICPLVNTAEDAARLVSLTHYPPLGERSFGPTRASVIYPGNYHATANAEVLTFAMIETQMGMENLEAIVRTPGLDAVYIGPSDLTLGLHNGRLAPGFDRKEPEMVAAIRRIIDTAHAAGIKACLHNGSSEYAAAALEWGPDLVTLLNDARLLAGAANEAVKRFRTLAAERQPPAQA